MLGFLAFFSAKAAFSRRPKFIIDENGICCGAPFNTTIAWEDVVWAERASRSEKTPSEDGVEATTFYVRDSGRPIHLFVRDREAYSQVKEYHSRRSYRAQFPLPGSFWNRLTANGVGLDSGFWLRLDFGLTEGSSAGAIQLNEYYYRRARPSQNFSGLRVTGQ
jgi:hypothetical protein